MGLWADISFPTMLEYVKIHQLISFTGKCVSLKVTMYWDLLYEGKTIIVVNESASI